MLPHDAGTWRFSTSFTGTKIDIRHVADDEPENPQPYQHVQELIVSELSGTAARGLRPGLGLEVRIPVRIVRDRVHYLDLAGQPYAPPNPGLHHRNETLTGVADPEVALHLGRRGRTWSMGGRFGLSIPVGKTEPNPFERGRQGLWHQHIQFGTGTWDPTLELAAGRAFGRFELEMSAAARLALYRNGHGYQAGDRYAFRMSGIRRLGKRWSLDGGLLFAHETAEEWGGRIETEGNLGRTDLFLSLGAARAIRSRGGVFFNVQIPVASHAVGHQVDIPAILSLGFTF